MRLPSGQALRQPGTPQSRQRAAWAARASGSKASWVSAQSPVRSAAGRSGRGTRGAATTGASPSRRLASRRTPGHSRLRTVADGQGIGGAGHHAAGAAHAVLQAGDAAVGLALLPDRDAHVAGLLAAPAVDAALLVHLDAVEAGVVEQAEGGAVGARDSGSRNGCRSAARGRSCRNRSAPAVSPKARPGTPSRCWGGTGSRPSPRRTRRRRSHFTWRSRHTQGPRSGLAAVGEARRSRGCRRRGSRSRR